MPSLRDGDLLLRPWRAADRTALEALMCDAEAMEHTGGALTREEAAELLARYVACAEGRGPQARALAAPEGDAELGADAIVAVYAVEHRGEVVGSADVVRFALPGGDEALEIGYAICRSHWRRGLGVRAAHLILGVARALARPGQRILALVDHGHDASIGVLRRIGMVPAGVHDDPDDGEVLVYDAPPMEPRRGAAAAP